MINNEIVIFVDKILKEAINLKASDIHFKQYSKYIDVSYRIEGIIHNIYTAYSKLDSLEIIARLKVLSKMNVTEKRLPQDGSYKYNEFDLRFATLPLKNGESLVIRILNSRLESTNFESLGFTKEKILKLNSMIKSKYGLILISGPTGSGKSTTLMSMINNIDLTKKKVISVEDPIENENNNILQIEINDKIGLTFANVLKSTLRMDPDIIVISEIRDEITARIAIRASLTGHLVIATIHASDIPTTINRLIEMGIEKYLLIDSLVGVISQRLEYINKIKKRVMINELIYVDSEIKEILSKSDSKMEMTKKLKNIYYNSIENEYKEVLEKI